MFNLIKNLCNLDGTSSNEKNVKDFIIKEIKSYCQEIKTDNLGNVIAFKKGLKQSDKKIMISAHMDEVGFIITSIESDGLLRFSPIGGVDPAVVIGCRVKVGENKLLGVIGNKPIHLLSSSEKKTKPTFDNLYIDIGTKSKEETQLKVDLGDFCYYYENAKDLGNGYLTGKAFDDRIGCAILIQLLKEDINYDTYFAFNTREESGLIGAKTTSFAINPDFSIVVECTTAGDNIGFVGKDKVCSLNDGVVISFMDKACIYDKDLYNKSIKLAEESNIKWQTKTGIFGGNDSSAIQQSKDGCKVIALSTPGRNLHTSSIVVKKSDIQNNFDLAKKLLNNIL
ncbi:MAG: M42 family metallopeptidase [Oscillospiraceae bacterium]